MTRAYFDRDGLCVAVADSATCAPRGGAAALVPVGTRPREVWWDGASVRASAPCDLPIPSLLSTSADPWRMALPAGVVAIVDGMRMRDELVIDRRCPRAVTVDLRGSQHGQITVEVRGYAEARAAEYPHVPEQLGALAKLVRALISAAPPPADALAILDHIEAVKALNPKE